MRRVGRWRARLGIGLLLVAVVPIAIAVVPPMRTVALSAALTYDLLGLPASPLHLLSAEPARATLAYGQPADRIDVYSPAGASANRRLPAVVLGLGVHPQPIDDPQVVALAQSIARLGVVVGVPDSSTLRATRLDPTEPAHLADAVLLVGQLPMVDPARVGLAGFSAGGSIALIAAADQRIAASLRYVAAYGAYANAATLLVDVASSTTVVDREIVPWQPDPGIRADVEAIARAWDPAAAASIFASPGRSTAQARVDALSAAQRDYLVAISPLSFSARIRAPVYLLHGRGDTAIPYAHSLALKDAIGDRAQLTTFGRFGHEQPGLKGLSLDDASDVWELGLYLRAIVAAATE
jgi:dienelactone hydrolase